MKLKGSKILIVDDEPHVCELLVRWLTPEDSTVSLHSKPDEQCICFKKKNSIWY